MLIVRELTGGLYFGEPSRSARRPRRAAQAIDTLLYTEPEVRRSSASPSSWRAAGASTSPASTRRTSWPRAASGAPSSRRSRSNSRTSSSSIGSSTRRRCSLITKPASFDVIVTENMFGDILSDEASRARGVARHAALRLARRAPHRPRRRPALFEPIHGSSPDSAGTDTANPGATILSAAMMLRWSLGQRRCRRGHRGRPCAPRSRRASGRTTCSAADAAASGRAPSGRRRSPMRVAERRRGCRGRRHDRVADSRAAGRPLRHDPARRHAGREHHALARRQDPHRADARRVRHALHRGRLARLQPQGHRVLRGRPLDDLDASAGWPRSARPGIAPTAPPTTRTCASSSRPRPRS